MRPYKMVHAPRQAVFLTNYIDVPTRPIGRSCASTKASDGQPFSTWKPVSDCRECAEQLGGHGVWLDQHQSILQLGTDIHE